MKYTVKHIADRLQQMGEGSPNYYGNELHSAKDLLVEYPEQRDAVIRWLAGRSRPTDYIRLQEAAMILRGTFLTTEQLLELAEEYLPTFEVSGQWPDISCGRDLASALGFGRISTAQHATTIQIAKQKWQAIIQDFKNNH